MGHNMNFTYDSFIQLICMLKDKNYKFCNYSNCDESKKTVIFRHDVDLSLEKAVNIAKIEYENNISSTFYVLLSTDFYNVFSKTSNDMLKNIMSLGHDIGLHFDEKRYEINNDEELNNFVRKECDILSMAVGKEVKSVSMHRPSRWILDNDIHFDSVINSYSKKFFTDFKYLSDSRMNWREDVLDIIKNEKYDRLHILTHPFWYEEEYGNIKERVSRFIKDANKERYYNLKDNLRDLDQIINEGDF